MPKISEFNTNLSPADDFFIPATKNGVTYKMSFGQIVDLAEAALLPTINGKADGAATTAALNTKANISTTYTKTEVDGLLVLQVPVGSSIMHNGKSAPAGYLKENGAAYSRTTYAALFAAITSSATVTMTIASPGVITWTNHGLIAGSPVRFSTTGALPTGLVAGTTYYVISTGLTTNTFQVSATVGGAAINTSGSQSGVHTALSAPYGYGDGSTTFNVPESRGEFMRGLDDGRGIDTGRVLGVAQADEFKSHQHGQFAENFPLASGGATQMARGSAGVGGVTNFVGGAETRPRNVPRLFCIKF